MEPSALVGDVRPDEVHERFEPLQHGVRRRGAILSVEEPVERAHDALDVRAGRAERGGEVIEVRPRRESRLEGALAHASPRAARGRLLH